MLLALPLTPALADGPGERIGWFMSHRLCGACAPAVVPPPCVSPAEREGSAPPATEGREQRRRVGTAVSD